MMTRETLTERWERERPQREARRAGRGAAGKAVDKTVGLGALLLLVLAAAVVLVLVGLLVWAVFAQWQTILFAAGAILVVVCASLTWQRARRG